MKLPNIARIGVKKNIQNKEQNLIDQLVYLSKIFWISGTTCMVVLGIFNRLKENVVKKILCIWYSL